MALAACTSEARELEAAIAAQVCAALLPTSWLCKELLF